MLISRRRSRPIFYGWVVVAVAFAVCAVMSAVWGSFAVFYVSFVEDFGWSRAVTAGAFSVFVAMMGLSASLAGWLVDRFGPRKVMPVGSVVLAVGLALASRVSEPWHLYLVYGVLIALGLSCVGLIPHLRLLSNWFQRQRGATFGLATSGFGFGMVVLLPAVQFVVLQFGWRQAYLALAILALLLAPLTGLLHRQQPSDMGLLPDGDEETDADGGLYADGSEPIGLLGDLGLRKAMSTTNFWIMFTSNTFLGLATLIVVFQVAHIVGVGFEPMLAATISGMAGLVSAVGRLMGGFLFDRVGTVATGLIGVGLLSLGVVASILAGVVHGSWLLFAYGLLFGLGWGFFAIVGWTITADLFQGKNYGTVAGSLEVGVGLGGFLAPWLGGYLYDRLGSYAWPFAIGIVSTWVCGACFKLAYRGARNAIVFPAQTPALE